MNQWKYLTAASLLALGSALLPTGQASADDLGVPGKKLTIQDKSLTTGKNSVDLLLTKDANIHKGADSTGSNPGLSGDLKLFINGSTTPAATFPMPAELWTSNKNQTARFKNPLAPTLTPTKLVIIKNATSGKVSAKGLGGLNAAGINSGDDIVTQITIINSNDGHTHRMCTKFSDVTVTFAGGNRKISGLNGLATTCPSTPPLCGTTPQSFTFTANSSGGGAFSTSQWPGGTQQHTFSAGCTVTIQNPNTDVTLVCSLGQPFAIVGFTGFSSCVGTGGEDGDGCNPVSCPPLGIGSCCNTRPSCSTGLNGDASATYHVTCNP